MKTFLRIKYFIFVTVITILIFSTCVSTSSTAETGEPNVVITVDVDTKYQYVRGFGGMEVGWGNFPRTSARDTELLFNPDTGLGLNILRIMIMPSNTDIRVTMRDLINGDRPDYYQNVKIVNKYGGYVLASPWSPPKDWKTNNDLLGNGRLNSKYYQNYADYLKSFALNMYENGAPIYAVSIQNEPNFEASYDGCLWSSAEMKNFFSQVGHFTDGVKGFGGGKEIPSVRTMNGESANHPNINDAALNSPDSRAVIDIIGRHTYGDRLNRYARALDHPTDPKEVWMTEHLVNSGNANGYPNDSTWNYVWKILNDIDLSIRINHESAFIWWAAKRFYGLMGDGQYDTDDGELLPRGYAMSHYAKFARDTYRVGITASGKIRDGSRISTANFNSNIDSIDGTTARVTAFVSPDGNTISLVMFTPTYFNGTDGVDMGKIKIQLPADFIIDKATAMRTSENSYAKWEEVEICEDKTSAIVSLPRGHILSVRFTK
jgi:O-glycosyl hydrolase